MAAPDWNHQYAELGEFRAHYVRHGAGRPLVLLHGWPEFWYTFHKNIPVLAERFDVIAPDLRGFGDSDKPVETPTVESYADDLKALADHLGLDRFGVVTHDVGSSVMQVFARAWPDRLAGLFLFNAPYPGIGRRWVEPEQVREIWYQSFHQLEIAPELVGQSRASCRIYFRHFLKHWAADPAAFDADLEAWVDNFMKPGNLAGGFAWYKAANAARLRMIREGPFEMPRIETPTRVLWGAADPIVKPEWRDRLADYFADIRVDLAPAAGHFVHYEQPDLANREITAFFEGLDW